jgi:hypothetical protein
MLPVLPCVCGVQAACGVQGRFQSLNQFEHVACAWLMASRVGIRESHRPICDGQCEGSISFFGALGRWDGAVKMVEDLVPTTVVVSEQKIAFGRNQQRFWYAIP